MGKPAVDWRAAFKAALEKRSKEAGVSLEGLKWEGCDTDRTWGDRCGLVFFGASPEVNERAAKFFEAWARKNLRKMGAVGGYNAQESIGYEGAFYFARYSNGAKGWYRVWKDTKLPVEGSVEHMKGIGSSGPWELKCEEVKLGVAVSYVYYPGAD